MTTELKTLIVEDSKADTELEIQALKRAGIACNARRVETEADFRTQLAEFDPDIVICDFSLPRFDGLSALRISQHERPDTPFIFVSGAIGEEQAIDLLKNGAADYILKGNPARLGPAVLRALNDAKRRQQNRIQEQKISRLNRVHAVLSGINTLIVRVRDRQELFDGACRIAVNHGNFGIAWIGSYDPGTLTVTPVAWAGALAELFTGYIATADHTLPQGRGGVGRAIRELKPIIVNDITVGPRAQDRRHQEAIRLGYRSLIVMPLTVDGAAVGTMSLFARERGFFTEDELKLLTDLAGNISFALAHIAKEEKVVRLSRIQAVMSNIDSLIVRVRDRQQLFEEACRITTEYGGFEIAYIGVFDQETHAIATVACAGHDAKAFTTFSGTGQNLAGRALTEKRAFFRNDITKESLGGSRRQEAVRRGYRSFVVLPLLVEGTAVANISMYAKEPNFFNEEELALLNQMASDISFALEHIAKEEKIARLSRIQAVTSNINSLIVRVKDRQELFNEACRIAVEHGGFGIAWIGTFDPDTNRIAPIAWSGLNSESFMRVPSAAWSNALNAASLVGQAIHEKRPVFNNDISIDAEKSGKLRQEAVRRGYRSLIALPLMVRGAAIGNLSLFAREVNFFTSDEVKLLAELTRDISFALEHIAKEEQLEYLAYYDHLTGLPNRTLFLDRINQQLHARASEPRLMAVILFDLERFRRVNETMGRHGGDELLRQVAQRLEHACQGKKDLARVGANGYGVVLRGARDAADIAHSVESKILSCFTMPYIVDGSELRLAAKAGIALYPTDGGDADTLFRNAEAALKKAKTSGDHYLFYAAEMNARAAHALSLETRIRKAVEAQQFVLHYQPKVELPGSRICGLEALIRWQDPESGLVPPGQFIPLLEETGLIIEVGQWALGQALADYRDWVARGYDAPRIAVNVSSIQLRRKDFVDMVSSVIGEIKGMPHGLDIEITESMIMENIETNVQKLKMLRDMNLDVAIDDFGTGYSSLSYLARLPVNALKIDRSFIIAMSQDADSMAIVSTIISLGHSLNMKTIAEGVETEEQLRFLKLLKCNQMQGYLFSKPLPKAQIDPMLTKN